jgi:hypothetical protein
MAHRLKDDESLDYLVTGKTAQELIKKLISDSEAVIEIRTFETLVQIANARPRLYAIFDKLGSCALIKATSLLEWTCTRSTSMKSSRR